MKIFTGYLITEYVPEDEWPDVGELYMALDQQNRLGPQTWLVAVQGEGTMQEDSVRIGLFWRAGIATDFIVMLDRNPDIVERHLEKVGNYYKELKAQTSVQGRGKNDTRSKINV